jgi:hypothetical protein
LVDNIYQIAIPNFLFNKYKNIAISSISSSAIFPTPSCPLLAVTVGLSGLFAIEITSAEIIILCYPLETAKFGHLFKVAKLQSI